MKKIKYLAPSIVFASLIFIISNQENIKLPEIGFDLIDKFLHFFAYLIFGLTIFWAIFNLYSEKNTRTKFVYLLIIGTIYALTDELHQSYIPGRTFDIFDIVADILGICASYLVFGYVVKLIKSIRGKFV